MMRFILIDRFIDVSPGERAIATKTFSPEEEFLVDHFPGFPVIPGTLLIEAMAQTGGWLIACTFRFSVWPVLFMIHNVKFRRFTQPGEELQIETFLRAVKESNYEVSAKVSSSGRRVAEARLFYDSQAGSKTLAHQEDVAELLRWEEETFRHLGGAKLLQGRPLPKI